MNGKAVFVIDNEEERDILAYNIARFPYPGIIPEYNSNNPYWFKNNDIACSNFKTIPFEFKLMLYTDFSVILEQSKYESMCFENKKIAEYGYEFNDGDQIWSDTAEIYKTDNDSLFIKKYEAGYTSEVKYSTISLNNLIEEIQQYKEDEGKSKRGGCFIIKDLPQDIIKPIPDTMLDKFLNSEVAIKIYNGKQHDAIMSQLKETGIDLKLEEFGDYDKDYPYYHIDKNVNSSKRSLNASMDMRHVIESKGIRWCVDFDSLDRIRKNTEEKEKTVKKNKDQYER